jgi:hypothetical protein
MNFSRASIVQTWDPLDAKWTPQSPIDDITKVDSWVSTWFDG